MSQAITFLDPRQQMTGLTHDGTWRDFDFSSFVPAGTKGVIVLAENSNLASNSMTLGLRPNGATYTTVLDTLGGSGAGYPYDIYITALDENLIAEYYSSDSDALWYVIGYTDDSVVFIDPVTKNNSTTSTWEDIDCTSNFGVDTGNVEAVILYRNGPAKYIVDFRKNGSSLSALFGGDGYGNRVLHFVGVDSNDIFEMYSASTANSHYLIGYIRKNRGFVAIDRTRITADSLSAWTDVDVTSQTSASAIGIVGIANMTNSSSAGIASKIGFRINSSSQEETPMKISITGGSGSEKNMPAPFIVGIDSSQVWEYYKTHADMQYDLLGYVEPYSSYPDNSVKANILASINQNNSIKANILVPSTTYTQDNSTKSNIVTTYSKDSNSIASIVVTGQSVNNVKSNILVNNITLDNVSKASIFYTYQVSNNSKANIPFKPVLVSPISGSSESTPITFVWNIPARIDNNPIVFWIQIDNVDDTFSNIEVQKISSQDIEFEYWNGSSWVTIPADGIPSSAYGNQARISLSLTEGLKYWRVVGGVY